MEIILAIYSAFNVTEATCLSSIILSNDTLLRAARVAHLTLHLILILIFNKCFYIVVNKFKSNLDIVLWSAGTVVDDKIKQKNKKSFIGLHRAGNSHS